MSGPDADYIELATVVKPHGLDGEVWVDLNTDFPERLPQWSDLQLVGPAGARQARVEYIRGITGGRCIVKLQGVEDRDQAEEIRAASLQVRRHAVPPPPDGEYYDFQILGLRVVTADGCHLGRIRDILRTGANDVYETDRALIPAVDRYIKEIDLERGEMVVQEVDDLLE
ncbi:MAG: ribosome maturation factor RimM [Armatimonadota bacterium]|nr:ribosome maturation factor RimM [Armatimonadota bacterium]